MWSIFKTPMVQDVFIIGATGKVGKTLVRQIIEKGDTNSRRHMNSTRIVGLASSNNFVYSPKGLQTHQSYKFVERKSDDCKQYFALGDLLDAVQRGLRHKKSDLVFVDVPSL